MAMQTLSMLRTEVKFRFIEYLKTSKSPYYEPALTVCPCCGQHASIVSDFMWSCTKCGRQGDVVDFAKESHGCRTEAEAVKGELAPIIEKYLKAGLTFEEITKMFVEIMRENRINL